MAQVAATIDGSPVTQQVLATIIAATAYDNSMPPGAQGQPKHPVWSLDESDPEQVMNVGGAYVAIYNIAAWQMCGSAGRQLRGRCHRRVEHAAASSRPN